MLFRYRPEPRVETAVGVAFRADVLDGIGITEMPHIFLSGRPGAVRPGTTGVAVPGYDPGILDNEGNEVVPGTPGMLFVRGDFHRGRSRGEYAKKSE